MKKFFTIGYEGASLADFVASLHEARVEQVLDIRELPQSRRPGFSKKALSTALSDAGIEYLHSKQLGDPKPGREAARSGDFVRFREIFTEHMDRPETIESLEQAVEWVSIRRTALLCFERDHRNCHRNIVAERVKSLSGMEVQHLGVQHKLAARGSGVHGATAGGA